MINEEKIALMTNLAIYEKGEGKKSIPMSKYYKSDYMSLKIMNSLILSTLVYLLGVAFGILIQVEQILEELVSMDFLEVGKKLLILYLIVAGVNVAMTYIISRMRFQEERKGLNQYNANLKKLYGIAKKEEKREMQATGGREDGYIGD